MSHHSLTALRLAHAAVDLPIPSGDWEAPILDDLRGGGLLDRHRRVTVEVPAVAALLEAADLQVTTMGRGPADDPAFFAAAAAAGAAAAGAVGATGALHYPDPE